MVGMVGSSCGFCEMIGKILSPSVVRGSYPRIDWAVSSSVSSPVAPPADAVSPLVGTLQLLVRWSLVRLSLLLSWRTSPILRPNPCGGRLLSPISWPTCTWMCCMGGVGAGTSCRCRSHDWWFFGHCCHHWDLHLAFVFVFLVLGPAECPASTTFSPAELKISSVTWLPATCISKAFISPIASLIPLILSSKAVIHSFAPLVSYIFIYASPISMNDQGLHFLSLFSPNF